MTEYWKSQPKKFCDFCKCWIADQKASIEFHESGRRHQQAVEIRLREISRKGALDERRAKKEEEWLQQMEAAAMRDYRSKDLGGNADITAKVFNSVCDQRHADSEKEDREKEKLDIAKKAAIALGKPLPSETCGPEADASASLKTVTAPKSGTKWHNAPEPKHWFEGKSEEGHVYYWHVETHESRWDPPPEGYLSISEQEHINKRHEEREMKKVEKIEHAQTIHSNETAVASRSAASFQGPASKPDPFGEWHAVKSRALTKTIDYQTPEAREPVTASITLHNDRLSLFEAKKTPSLQDSFEPDLDAGIVPKSEVKAAPQPAEASKPAIVFRKRKINPNHKKIARRKEDEFPPHI